jgi:proteic killer suppression protein
MKISFANEDLENLCLQIKLASRKLGRESATKLQRRLVSLLAAPDVSDLKEGRPHPLAKERHGQFALDLHGGHRLIFKPTQQPPPQKPDGSIDWSQVKDVTILEAIDYHD